MFSLSTSQVFVSSLEKLLLGGWEGDTCVVTSMSLVVQHPTAGCSLWCVGAGMVQQQLLGSFPSSALSMLLLHHILGPLQAPLTRFSYQHWHVLLGKGRSSLFPAEPVARAFTSTTDRSKTWIK